MRRRTPTKRLLLVPLVLLAVIVAGTELLARSSPVTDIDPVDTALLPEVGSAEVACQRGDDEDGIAIFTDVVTLDRRVTSTAIVSCPQAYDKQLVRYVGEAIGDVKRRDGGAWLLVNDDAYALEVGPLAAARQGHGYNSGLNVWMTDEQIAEVTLTGGPRARGDVLEIVGQVERTDPADGGALTLRAHEMTVLAEGARFTPPLHRAQAAVAAVLVVVTALSLLSVRRHRRR